MQKSRAKTKVVSSSDESSSDGASDGQVEHSSEEESDEELATAMKKQKGTNGSAKNGKRRVVDDEDEDESSDESDEDSQNRRVAPSKSGKGKVNNSRTAKSSAESSKSSNSNNSKASLNNGQVKPLQPHGAQPRSPFRTVSLNDASPGASRRRLSNSRVSRADDLRRQSLPSSLRKQVNAADGDSSFASNASSSHDVSVRRGSGAGGGSHNSPSKQGLAQAGLRRTSAGYALGGGGISTLNAAAALKRHASGASAGTSANDFTATLPTLTMEVMNTNYEEWMKMATDNVGYLSSVSADSQPLLANDSCAFARKSTRPTLGLSRSSITSTICRFCETQTMKGLSTFRKLLARLTDVSRSGHHVLTPSPLRLASC